MDIENGKYWQRGWQLVDGCTPCSPGCDHCWSASMTHRFNKTTPFPLTHRTRGFSDYGKFNGNLHLHPERYNIPLKRRKPTVFAIWNDLFHERVPGDFVMHAYKTMFNCPRHTFLILTKRPEVMAEFFLNTSFMAANIYHGLTVCNQPEADAKIPEFLKVPGKKFLSIEPMLGEINFSFIPNNYGLGESQRWYDPLRRCAWYATNDESYYDVCKCEEGIDAVILGGETGAGARPMHPEWVRSVRDQCAAAGVDFFLKHINKKDGRALDGKTYDQLPWRKNAI